MDVREQPEEGRDLKVLIRKFQPTKVHKLPVTSYVQILTSTFIKIIFVSIQPEKRNWQDANVYP